MSVHFVNTTRDEFLSHKLIFKYMSLENGLCTMKNHQLWFANPTIWSDPFEKRFIEAQYKVGAASRKFTWKDRVYCACFTNVASNEAAWKVYTDKSLGVEFAVNREELINALDAYSANNPHHNIYIGKVEYMQTKNIRKADVNNIPFNPTPAGGYTTAEFKARLLMLKRMAFSYENEIRIIIVRPDISKVVGIQVPFADSNLMFKSITLDPNMGELTTEVLKKAIPTAEFLNCGVPCNDRIKKSRIYTPSKPTNLKA